MTVDNGDAAIARARQERPDLILADVVMPGKSGYEVCEAIKADPSLRHIPVLLLTGTFEAFDEARAARVGAAGHVAKPFESQTLVEQVKRLLAQSEQQRAAAPRPAPAPAAPAQARPPAAAPRTPLPPPTIPRSRSRRPTTASSSSTRSSPSRPRRPPPPPPRPTTPSRWTRTIPRSRSATPSSRIWRWSRSRPRGRAHPRPPPESAPSRSFPTRRRPPTRPVAIGRFEEIAVGGDEGDAEFAPLEAPSTAGDDAFEFEFDSPSSLSSRETSLRVDEGGDLAQATVLDPKGASGYDVSSSDLRESLSAPASRRAARRTRPAAPARPPAARREAPAASFEPIVSPEDSFSGMPEEMADEAEFAPLAGDDELDESSLEVLEPPRPAPAARRAPAEPGCRRPLRARRGRSGAAGSARPRSCARSSTTRSRRSPGSRSAASPSRSCARRWSAWRQSPGR